MPQICATPTKLLRRRAFRLDGLITPTLKAAGSNPVGRTKIFSPCHGRGKIFWYARLDSNQRPLESELSGRQAGKPCGARVWLVLHKFAAFYEKTSEALRHKASEVFRSSSQIVVWIKCGFSSPVQLNIFTLYPWIRSAASHPSTLARSSTIPACAFASSYCFCS